jgi:replicative DNA helicase
MSDQKILPQAIQLEESVLGSLMEFPDLIHDVRDLLKPKSFYKESHQIIYSAIIQLDKQNKPFDILMVCEYLKSIEKLEEVGGHYIITKLSNFAHNNILEKALIVQQQFLKRELIKITSEINNKAFDNSEDVFDIIGDLESSIENLQKNNNSGVYHIEDCVKDVINVIDNNIKGITPGILTGFKDYDDFTNGDQPGDLIIIAGETSQGKTALALCKAFNQAMFGYNVAIFSYEMSKNQITARLMALSIELSAKKLLMDKLNDFELEQLNNKIQKLIESNIYIIEVERNSLDWLKAKIKTIRSKFKIDSIIVDYVQLITVDGLPKNQQIGKCANDLKFLAKHKNINIPITLVSQLKRDSSNPKPELWRLKESGDIENAADTVIGIWRPYHYNIYEFNVRKEENLQENINTSGVGIMHILKGRNIGLKDFVLNWSPHLTKFSNYKSTPF